MWTALAVTLSAASLRASERIKTVAIEYRIAGACPSREAFLEQLAQRLCETTRLEEQSANYQIAIELELDANRYVGYMRYADDTGQPVVRTLAAANCEELARGMALVVALALETLGNGAEPPQKTVDEAPTKSEEPSAATPQAATPAAKRVESKPPIVASPRRVPEGDRDERPRLVARAGAEQSLGLLVGADTAISPRVALVAGGEWTYFPGAGYPLIRVAAKATSDRFRSRSVPGLGSSRFELLALTAKLCAGVQLFPRPRTAANFCGGLEAGRYVARGEPEAGSAASGFDYPMFWGAALLEPELRVVVGGVYFGLGPELTFPLIRRQFATRNPTSVLHEVPPVAVGATFRAGVTFR